MSVLGLASAILLFVLFVGGGGIAVALFSFSASIALENENREKSGLPPLSPEEEKDRWGEFLGRLTAAISMDPRGLL